MKNQPNVAWRIWSKTPDKPTDPQGFATMQVSHVDGQTETHDLKLVEYGIGSMQGKNMVSISLYVTRSGQWFIVGF